MRVRRASLLTCLQEIMGPYICCRQDFLFKGLTRGYYFGSIQQESKNARSESREREPGSRIHQLSGSETHEYWAGRCVNPFVLYKLALISTRHHRRKLEAHFGDDLDACAPVYNCRHQVRIANSFPYSHGISNAICREY